MVSVELAMANSSRIGFYSASSTAPACQKAFG